MDAAPVGFYGKDDKGHLTVGTTLEKIVKQSQLGMHETVHGSFEEPGERGDKDYIEGKYTGEHGALGVAFFAENEIVGSGMGLSRQSALRGYVRYARKSFKARGPVDWLPTGTTGELNKPLVIGYENVDTQKHPITYKGPPGSTPRLAHIGRFDKDDENSYVVQVENTLDGYSGQFKFAAQGIKSSQSVGSEENFDYWSPEYNLDEHSLLRKGADRPFEHFLSKPSVKVERSALAAAADYIAVTNPTLAASLGLASPTLTEENYKALAEYANEQKGYRFMWKKIHESELVNAVGEIACRRAQAYADELDISPEPERIGDTEFFHVPQFVFGHTFGILYQLQEQYPTKRNVLSMEQLYKIASSNPDKYGSLVARWQRHGGTPERKLAMAYMRNMDGLGAQELIPISLRAMQIEEGMGGVHTTTEKMGIWSKAMEALGLKSRRPFYINLESFLGLESEWSDIYKKASENLETTLPGTTYVMPPPNVIAALAQSRESGQETSRLVTLYIEALEGLTAFSNVGTPDEIAKQRQEAIENVLKFHKETTTYLSGEKVQKKVFGARVRNQVGAPAVTSSALAPNQVALGDEAINRMWGIVDESHIWRTNFAKDLMASGRAGVGVRCEPSSNESFVVAQGISEEQMLAGAKPGTIIPQNLGWNMAVSQTIATMKGGDFDADLFYALLTGEPHWLDHYGKWSFGKDQPLRASSVDEILKQAVGLMRRYNPEEMDKVAGKPLAVQLVQAQIWHSESNKAYKDLSNPKPAVWSAEGIPIAKEGRQEAFLLEMLAKRAVGAAYFAVRMQPVADKMSERIPDEDFKEQWRQDYRSTALLLYQSALDRSIKNIDLLSSFWGTDVRGNFVNAYKEGSGDFPLVERITGSQGVSPYSIQSYLVRQYAEAVATRGEGELMPSGAAAALTMNQELHGKTKAIFDRVRSGELEPMKGGALVQQLLGEDYYKNPEAGPLLRIPIGSSLAKAGNVTELGLLRDANLASRVNRLMGKAKMPIEEKLDQLVMIPRIGLLGEQVCAVIRGFSRKQWP